MTAQSEQDEYTPYDKDWYVDAVLQAPLYREARDSAQRRVERARLELSQAQSWLDRYQRDMDEAAKVSEVYEGVPLLVYRGDEFSDVRPPFVSVSSPVTNRRATVRATPSNPDLYMFSGYTSPFGTNNYGREEPRWTREQALEHAKRWVAFDIEPA